MQNLTGRLLRVLPGTPVNNTTGNTNLANGFVVGNALPAETLAQVTGTPATNFGPGTFGFFDPKTYRSIGSSNVPTDCCPLLLIGAPLYDKDFISTLVGGYKKPIVSPLIDPRRIKLFKRIDPCTPQPALFAFGAVPYNTNLTAGVQITDIEINSVTCNGTGSISTNCSSPTTVPVSVTNSNFTIGGSFTICNPSGNTFQINIGALTLTGSNVNAVIGQSFTATVGTAPNTCDISFTVKSIELPTSACCFDFKCGESYSFLFQLRGTPFYQAFNSVNWRVLTVGTPCCDGSGNDYIDPLYVYWQLALLVAQDPTLKPFIYPVVYSNGNYYYPTSDLYPDVTIPGGALTFADIPAALQANSATSFCGTATGNAGIYFQTAYVETRFGDCSFTIKEGYTYDLIDLIVSLRDWESLQCKTGICFRNVCAGHTGEGAGEYAIRDLIHSESHRGYIAASATAYEDIRYKEAEQAQQLLNIISRTKRYYQYVLVFDVKREGNWLGLDPFEEWVINIYSETTLPAFEAFMDTWTANCACPKLEVIECNQCELDAPYLPGLVTPSTNV